jgi:hypothetical protein
LQEFKPALNDIWTSGAISRGIINCAQDLSIFWCSSNHNVTLPWWKSKLTSIGNETMGKIISMKITTLPELSIKNESMDLPFLCEVI